MNVRPESSEAPLVAIVDDDDSLRISTQMLVEAFGFRAEGFARAQDFLASPSHKETACLILDFSMPEMDGLELQLQLLSRNPSLPIIFITAQADEHEEKLAINSGAVAVLRKPVAGAVLLCALITAIP